MPHQPTNLTPRRPHERARRGYLRALITVRAIGILCAVGTWGGISLIVAAIANTDLPAAVRLLLGVVAWGPTILAAWAAYQLITVDVLEHFEDDDHDY